MNKFIQYFKVVFLLTSMLIILSAGVILPVLAAETLTPAPTTPITGEGGVLAKVANAIFTILLLASVIAFVIGAFLMVAASGDPQKFEVGKKTILYAIIGLVIAFGAKGLRNFIVDRLK